MGIIQQVIANSLISGSVYAILAIGITLTYGATRFFNFAHGSFGLIGAYIVFALTKSLGIPPFFAFIIGVLCAGVVAVLLEMAVFARLRKNKAPALVGLIASLGALTAFQALLSLIFDNQFQSLADAGSPARLFHIGSATVTEYQIIALIMSFVVVAVVGIFIHKSLTGKAIKALSDDEEVARIVGINTNKIMRIIYFVAGATAGIAGIIVGYDIGIDPAQGMYLFIKGTIAAVIGGLGSIPGAFLGGYLLGFVENFGIISISSEWKTAIAFLLLIIFLIVRPQGIFKK